MPGDHGRRLVGATGVAFGVGALLAATPVEVWTKTRGAMASLAGDTVDVSVVPPDSAMPRDSLGASMRRGRALLLHTHDSLPAYAPSDLRCVSCHLDNGRRPLMTLVGAFARYPRWVDRSARVASIEDRINYCLARSLSGRALPVTSRPMRDMVSYLAFLSTGVPTRGFVRGEGTPSVPKLDGDSARGASLFVRECVRCHGAAGEGSLRTGDTLRAPALWGPRSFTVAAGMARPARATAFIRHAMPYDRPGSLTDQEAADLAAFVLSRPRPDFAGKSRDWPAGGAPNDVPYATLGHAAYRPPPLITRGDR